MTFNSFIKSEAGIKTAKSWARLAANQGWSDEKMALMMRTAYNELKKGGLV